MAERFFERGYFGGYLERSGKWEAWSLWPERSFARDGDRWERLTLTGYTADFASVPLDTDFTKVCTSATSATASSGDTQDHVALLPARVNPA